MSTVGDMLSESEKDFLRSQKISENDIFDGRFLGKEDRESEAKKLNKILIVGPKCAKAGHRLRTRSGHCAQCDTRKIRYQERHNESAILYVAYSPNKNISKIGVSIDIKTRERKLNFDAYAGASDWQILFSLFSSDAGKIEDLSKRKLQNYRYQVDYFKDRSQFQNSTESFNCNPTKAIEAVLIALKDLNADSKDMKLDELRIKKYLDR